METTETYQNVTILPKRFKQEPTGYFREKEKTHFALQFVY